MKQNYKLVILVLTLMVSPFEYRAHILLPSLLYKTLYVFTHCALLSSLGSNGSSINCAQKISLKYIKTGVNLMFEFDISFMNLSSCWDIAQNL